MTTFDELEARVMYDIEQTDDPDALVAMLLDPETRWYARTRLASLAVKGLTAAYWNPLLHPRGRDGKFIKRWGLVRWLDEMGKWTQGQVTFIDSSTGDITVLERGKEVYDDAIHKINQGDIQYKLYTSAPHKAYLKLPDPKTGTEVEGFTKTGGQGGSNPGGMYTIDSAMGGKSIVKGDVIDVQYLVDKYGLTAAGNHPTLPYGGLLADKMVIAWDSEGRIGFGITSASKGTFFGPDEEILNYEDFVDPKFVIGPRIEEAWAEFIDAAELLSDGDKIYIKAAKSKEHARNEVLANRLYEMAGVNVAETILGDDGITIGSRLIPKVESKIDIGDALGDAEVMEKMRRDFVIDAWLANWDVAGLNLENTQVVDGSPYRIDAGGGLLYRAQGGPKGDKFGTVVGELDTMRDAKKNAAAAQVFGKITDEELLDGAVRLAAVDPEKIRNQVLAADMPESLADTLVARRAYILNKLGVDDPFVPYLPTAEELHKQEQDQIAMLDMLEVPLQPAFTPGEDVDVEDFVPDDAFSDAPLVDDPFAWNPTEPSTLEALELELGELYNSPALYQEPGKEIKEGQLVYFEDAIWMVRDVEDDGTGNWHLQHLGNGEKKDVYNLLAAGPQGVGTYFIDDVDAIDKWLDTYQQTWDLSLDEIANTPPIEWATSERLIKPEFASVTYADLKEGTPVFFSGNLYIVTGKGFGQLSIYDPATDTKTTHDGFEPTHQHVVVADTPFGKEAVDAWLLSHGKVLTSEGVKDAPVSTDPEGDGDYTPVTPETIAAFDAKLAQTDVDPVIPTPQPQAGEVPDDAVVTVESIWQIIPENVYLEWLEENGLTAYGDEANILGNKTLLNWGEQKKFILEHHDVNDWDTGGGDNATFLQSVIEKFEADAVAQGIVQPGSINDDPVDMPSAVPGPPPEPAVVDGLNGAIHTSGTVDLFDLPSEEVVGKVVAFSQPWNGDTSYKEPSTGFNAAGLYWVESFHDSNYYIARNAQGQKKYIYKSYKDLHEYRFVNNISADDLKGTPSPTLKANGDIVIAGQVVGTWEKDESYYSYYGQNYSFTIQAAYSVTGHEVTGKLWKKTELRDTVASMTIPMKVPTKSKAGSKAVKKIEAAIAKPVVLEVGANFFDGTPAKKGDWVQATKGGGGFVGKIVGWPDQDTHPGLVFAVAADGVQKIIKLKTHKKVDTPSDTGPVDDTVPNAYVGIEFADGKIPKVGQKVTAGVPGKPQTTGIINHLNTKQGWAYILTDDGKLVSKTFSVIKVDEEPDLVWDVEAAAAAVLTTTVDKAPKKPKVGKIGYPGPDDKTIEQDQSVKDAWLAGNPKRKLTKDGFAPKVGMFVRNKDGDLAVITEINDEWASNPNGVSLIKFGKDNKKAAAAKGSVSTLQVDHEAELTGAGGKAVVEVVEVHNVEDLGVPTNANLPVGSVVYRVKGNLGSIHVDGKVRPVSDWQYIAELPDGSYKIIKTTWQGPTASLGSLKLGLKNTAPKQMEKVAVVVAPGGGHPQLSIKPFKKSWNSHTPSHAGFGVVAGDSAITWEVGHDPVDLPTVTSTPPTPVDVQALPPHVTITAKKGPTGNEWEGAAVVHHDDGTTTGKSTPYYFSPEAAIEAAKAMVAEDPDYFALKEVVVDDTDIPEPPEEIPVAEVPEVAEAPEIPVPEAAPEVTDVIAPPIVVPVPGPITPPPAPPEKVQESPTYPALPTATGEGADNLKKKLPILAGTKAMSVAEAAAKMLELKDSTEAGTGSFYGMGDSDMVEDMLFRHNVQIINGQEYLVTRTRLREDATEGMAATVLSAGQAPTGAWKLKGMVFAANLEPGDLINVYVSGHTHLLKPGRDNPDYPTARVLTTPVNVGKSTVNTEYDLYRVKVQMNDGSIGEVDMEMRPQGSIDTYEWDHDAIPKSSYDTLGLTPVAQQAGWQQNGKMRVPGSQGSNHTDGTGKANFQSSFVSSMAKGSGGFHFDRTLEDGTKIQWNTAHSTESGTGVDTTRRAVISGEVRILTPITDGKPVESMVQSVSTALEHVGIPVEKQAPPGDAEVAAYALQKFVANYHPDYKYRAKAVSGPDDPRVVETLTYMNKELTPEGGPVTLDDVRLHTHSDGRVSVVLSPRVGQAIAKRQGNKAYSHSGFSSGIGSLFGSPHNGVKSTDERWSLGVMTTGLSSHSDMTIGSGDRIYMRGVTSKSFHSGAVIMNASVMNMSTEIYVNQRNDVGVQHGGYGTANDDFGRRGVQNRFMVTGGGVEVMHKRAIDVEQVAFYVTTSPGPIINDLKSKGVTHIAGRPIEEIIVTPAKAAELWNPDLGMDVFKDDISITSLLSPTPSGQAVAP